MKGLKTVLSVAAALSAPVALGVGWVAPDAAQGGQGAGSDRSRIVGTYRLIAYESRDAGGNWVRTPNFASYGYLTYFDTGHVAEYSISRTRPRPTGQGQQGRGQGQAQGRGQGQAQGQGRGQGQAQGQGQGRGLGLSAPDALAVLQGTTGYYGTFSVDDKSKTLTHRYAGHIVPGAPDGKFAYTLEGDRFTLTPGPANAAGRAPERVVWERLPEPPLSAEARKFVGFYRLLYTDTLREKGGKEISHENRSEVQAGSAILYTASGHMMAHLMNREGRIGYKGAEATPEEAQQGFRSYSGYFGRFTTFENYKPIFVLHNQQGTPNASNNFVDATKRFYQFTGNVLRLGTPPTTNAEGITSYNHLYWERQPAVK
jgi:hypothetical protein